MSNVSNAKNVSGKIFVELKDAEIDGEFNLAVSVNGFIFHLTEETKRIGFEKFEKGMRIDLEGYLNQKNILYLNTAKLRHFKTYHIYICEVYKSKDAVCIDMTVDEWGYFSCDEATCSVSSQVLEKYSFEELKAMEGKRAAIDVLEHKSQIIRLEPTKELKHVRAENLRGYSIELDGKNYDIVGLSHFSDENLFRYKFDGKAFVDATVYESEGIIADIKLSKEQSGNDDGKTKEHAAKSEAPASKPASVKSETPKGTTKKLTAVITEITDKSISLDGEEFFLTKYTKQATEPSVDLSVDAEVYITANGKKYLNSIKAVGSDSDAADTSTKDENKTGKAPYSGTSGKAYRKPGNRKTVSGEISAASAKGVMIDQTWYILSPYSEIEDESLLEKGENVTVVYTFSESKGINYINKLSAAKEPVTA